MKNNSINLVLIILVTMTTGLFAADNEAASNAIKEASNWAAYIGAGIGAGLVTIGAGLGIGLINAKSTEAIGRQPEAVAEIRTTALIMSALIEGVALFSAVTCFLLQGK